MKKLIDYLGMNEGGKGCVLVDGISLYAFKSNGEYVCSFKGKCDFLSVENEIKYCKRDQEKEV